MKKIAFLLDEFNLSISQIENENLNRFNALNRKIKVSNQCLHQFRILLNNEAFSSKKEEINFFKIQKPYVQGRLQYYLKVKNYLLEKPKGTISKKRKFIHKQWDKIDNSYQKYADFIKYYRLEKNDLDHLFFLRGNEQFDLFLDSSQHYDDPIFSTRHDYIIATIIANDLLVQFFNKELALLKKEELHKITEVEKPSLLKDLSWTASKTDLVELLYGLSLAGAIKNGEAEMKKMVLACKELFDIDLGNVYKTFGEIKSREKDKTKFLDAMKLKLLQKISSE